MLTELKHYDEEGRICALNRLEVLDTAEEVPFEKIVNLVQQILQTPMCAVSLVDRHRQWFKARRGLGVSETARDISFCTHAIQQSNPFIIRDALEDPRFSRNPLVTDAPFIRSYAGVPLRTSDGYNVGSLCAIDTKPRLFPDAEIAILENFARIVVDELELRQIASSDHLTGALSRRAWTEKAKLEIDRAQRDGRPLSLAIFDIDKFKLINDTFGHPAGDLVIKAMAGLCMSTIRQSDVFGRLGGEEFGLIMPETGAADAKVLVDRIRMHFAREPINLGQPVSSSVSIGVTERKPGEVGLDTLVERADRALYAAKHEGRNRTVLIPQDVSASKLTAA